IIFEMYDELIKEGSKVGKHMCGAYNNFNRERGIKIITLEYEKILLDLTMNKKKYYAGYKFELQSDGTLPDYHFSKEFAGARDHISRDAKLYNKKLVFDEMIDAYMREHNDFKKYSSMKRFSNLHVRGLSIVRRDANNSTKVMQQMTYSRLFDYHEKSKFITERRITSFDEFFDFFVNSRDGKDNWLRSCLEHSTKSVIQVLARKMQPDELYIVEDSMRVNARE
ncbi:26654_t:CDS:1, partial [Dentiscutata erythropus]